MPSDVPNAILQMSRSTKQGTIYKSSVTTLHWTSEDSAVLLKSTTIFAKLYCANVQRAAGKAGWGGGGAGWVHSEQESLNKETKDAWQRRKNTQQLIIVHETI